MNNCYACEKFCGNKHCPFYTRTNKKSELAAMHYLAKIQPKRYKFSKWKKNSITLMDTSYLYNAVHTVELGA